VDGIWRENGGEKLYSAFPNCSKLIKKTKTKLYVMRLILILLNFAFTPAVLDSNCNILIYYTFTVF